MNGKWIGSLALMLAAAVAHATPVLTVQQPSNSQLATPTKVASLGGTLINFDSLAANTSYATTYSTAGVSISSPDGLVVLPYSTQSGPNELYDNSAAGSANLTVLLTGGYSAIGVGIADSDPVTVTIQALGAGGVNLGPAFFENLSATQSTVNTGNGYYVVRDTTSDIYGLRITQALSNVNYSGLAIDDVQLSAAAQVSPVPEPSSLLLVAEGMLPVLALGTRRLVKKS